MYHHLPEDMKPLVIRYSEWAYARIGPHWTKRREWRRQAKMGFNSDAVSRVIFLAFNGMSRIRILKCDELVNVALNLRKHMCSLVQFRTHTQDNFTTYF